MKNSFLIATNRDYERHAKIVVNELQSYGALEDGEVIVCCPFEINDARVHYIEDVNQQNGNVAFNEAAKCSKGEYIYILCDDHHIPTSIARGNELLDSVSFQNRNFKIASMASGAPCYIEPIPNFPSTNFIPRHVMCRFPFFTREMYIKHLNNHVFHPNFNICSHFADNYLSYFLAINGEPTIECNFIRLQPMQNTDQFDDGSVEPFGGPENKYPTGYIESLEVYVDLCKKLQKNDPYVGSEKN
jgi:hypothetical protein